MLNFLRKLFGGETKKISQEILYCRKDGTKLDVVKEVLDYSPYTGEALTTRTTKTCPLCGTQPEVII